MSQVVLVRYTPPKKGTQKTKNLFRNGNVAPTSGQASRSRLIKNTLDYAQPRNLHENARFQDEGGYQK